HDVMVREHAWRRRGQPRDEYAQRHWADYVRATTLWRESNCLAAQAAQVRRGVLSCSLNRITFNHVMDIPRAMANPDFSSPETIEQYRRGLAEFFREFPFFKLMGIELVSVEPYRARLRCAWRSDLCQPAGIMHGGVIATIVDTAIAQSLLLTPEF